MHDNFDIIDLKVAEAEMHLASMGQVIIPPEHCGNRQAHLLSSHTIIHHDWHDGFNKDLNSFLPATRSIPEMIEYRFGYDQPDRNTWLLSLDQQEKNRRENFRDQFKPKHKQFRALPLTKERDITAHREGVAHWEIRVKGRFGTYIGGPKKRIPSAESRPPVQGEDPALSFLDTPLPIVPRHPDFFWVIPQPNGSPTELPLFPECRSYLETAKKLVADGRKLFQSIHNGHPFTLPSN